MLTDTPETADTALIETAIQVASNVLYAFTKRRYPGTRTDTIRPTCKHHNHGDCSCAQLPGIRLPFPPIVSITEVLIDGELVPPAEYRIDGDRLVRLRDTDGTQHGWPTSQDLTLETTEPRTWSVTYVHGCDPPEGGVRACIELAEQLVKAWTPSDGSCRLPQRVTSISRQGVSLAVLDPLTLFAEGRTGLSFPDLWIGSELHGDARRPGAVIDVAGQVSSKERRRRFR